MSYIPAQNAKHALRKVLRAIDQNITIVNGDRSWRNYAIAQFRQNSQEQDAKIISKQICAAVDYAYLVESVRSHRDLLFSYNISTSKDAGQMAQNTRTAAAVGLGMPKTE
ncbi:hypothetical protein CYMTET_37774 [Cymbomonas tetramitiformis]|uniref:Uncharacterized protein n=1 Tax=Cymbomonas tetramitiformis TaxID=36881 RepID=A0AAE0CEL6_9CHLO|nr:hypothetical protein CYMTET_37774 [Cymbomonas tetramitiformis]